MPEVLDRFRSSTWGWLRGTLLGWLTLLLCLVGVGFLIILIQWIRFLDVTYELTEDRLILRKGIFVKSIDEIELYRVKDVRMDFTLISQWVGIGTISIDSSDETTRAGALVMPYIERAAQRREEMRQLVDAARQKRRVRELDVSSDLL
ncbi:PH domain-containing protein [Sphingopyxis sp.]|uniref:PH domain-containing protein n=1 Tax=Sphingopyxis sp. TaxID=1908224 RepID=UPI001D75CCAC|nr:PH domain-containing protein [Sphingopyxis sp.]MBW8297720.1 PH domain-containing protein [Sphingopyxis sp.]